ncbi:hypothetical protein ElyMa_004913700, partial [Elysia marginata]
ITPTDLFSSVSRNCTARIRQGILSPSHFVAVIGVVMIVVVVIVVAVVVIVGGGRGGGGAAAATVVEEKIWLFEFLMPQSTSRLYQRRRFGQLLRSY